MNLLILKAERNTCCVSVLYFCRACHLTVETRTFKYVNLYIHVYVHILNIPVSLTVFQYTRLGIHFTRTRRHEAIHLLFIKTEYRNLRIDNFHRWPVLSSLSPPPIHLLFLSVRWKPYYHNKHTNIS